MSKLLETTTIIILAHRDDQRLYETLVSVSDCAHILLVNTSGTPLINLPTSLTSTQLTLLKKPGQVDSFAELRNWAISNARTPWVFFVDSDELVSEPLLEEICQLELDEHTPIEGYQVRRIDIFHDQRLYWGEVRQVYITRLLKRSAARFERSVHEIAIPTLVGRLKHPLHHVPHLSIAEFLQKVSMYARLEATLRSNRGDRFHLWQLLLYPFGKLLYNLCVKGGLLDGYRGIIYAVMMSIHSAAVRIYLYEHLSKTSS